MNETSDPITPRVGSFVRAAFESLDAGGVRWCLLRGEPELELPGVDVDLLVARADLRRAAAALRRAGFARLPAPGRAPHRFFLGYDPAGGWVKLDAVTELAFGPSHALSTRAAAGCLGRRVRRGDVAVLAADDAFWTLLVHCLLDKRFVAAHHGARLAGLAADARTDGELAGLVARLCPDGWTPQRVVAAAAGADWDSLVGELAPALERRWRRRRPWAGFVRPPARRALRALARRLGPVGARAPSVALLAPDGAGKSTVAERLRTSFPLPARVVYMGLYPNGRGRRAVVPGLGLARRLLAQWRRCLLARFHQRRGRLVVFDRYSYDALLPAPGRGRRARLARWLLARSCPPPDLVVLLDGPAEVLHARKPEHGVAALEEQRNGYLALRPKLGRLVVVDASRNLEDVVRDVTGAVWTARR